jgi:hypothetical protein
MKKILIFAVAAIILISSGVLNIFAEETIGAAQIPENATNLALECEAVCEIGDVDTYPEDNPSLENPAWFTAHNLTDGIHNTDIPTASIPTDLELSWYGASKKQDTDIYITIELDRLSDVYCVKLVPTAFLNGCSLPSSFTVNLSENGSDWVQIGEESGITENGGTLHTETFEYYTNMRAMYVMVHVTRASGVHDQNYYYSGIDEIEAWGVAVPKPTAAPTEEPVATEEPAATDEPAKTDEGDATAAPVATEKSGENSGNNDEKKAGLSTPAIIGIIAGAVAVIAVICVVIALAKKKKK